MHWAHNTVQCLVAQHCCRTCLCSQPTYARIFIYVDHSQVGKVGGVVFSTSSEEEGIEITTDWPEGELMWKDSEPFHQTGFIGQGYTKRAIYVCVTTHSTCHVADLGLIFSATFRAKRRHSLRSWGKGARVSC